jgi:muramoyltetrapeptide carboxypeptidase LdcA involved in peptidoglycan recycling
MIKPKKLQPGDKIAAVTLSWGGAGTIPMRYEAGKRQLEQAFGVQVVETKHALRDAGWIAKNPKARADDLMEAFADPTIKGIIATIGGDDSIRTLPYLDLDVIHNHPKVFVGYSDTTVTHLACYKAGLVSFYGPSIMAGFAENGGLLPYMEESVRKTLFSSEAIGEIKPNADGWTVEFLDWANPELQNQKRKLTLSNGWRYLQGSGVHRGQLIGGCMELLEWLCSTDVFPSIEAWHGAILFLETSEEAPPPHAVTHFLRILAVKGILKGLSGILMGRPGGNIPAERFAEYDEALMGVVCDEEGLTHLPIVTQMDFGHTDPIFVLPYGVMGEIDCDLKRFSIAENAVID